MKNILLLCIIPLTVILFSCQSESPLETDYGQVVIRAYLYAGEAVKDVRLTSTLAIGSQDSIAPPINDASVRLVRGGVSYPLVSSGGDSGYYHYDGTDLTVNPGESFEIKVDYFGRTAQGETQVPLPPENVTISSETLYVVEDFSPWDSEFDSTRQQIQITWEGSSDDLFFVTIENIEDNPASVSSSFPGFPGGGGFGSGLYTSTPRSQTEYQIGFQQITYYGRHEVKIYRVNQEYADLYISRQQDSRDLNEPLSNIQNGLGIFSAFSSVSVYFDAVKE